MDAAAHFMEEHGEQVLTALRNQVRWWEDTLANVPEESEDRDLIVQVAEDQVLAWKAINDKAQAIVDGEPPVSMIE